MGKEKEKFLKIHTSSVGIWKQNSCGLLFAVSVCAGIVVVFLVKKKYSGYVQVFLFVFFIKLYPSTCCPWIEGAGWRSRTSRFQRRGRREAEDFEQSKRRCVRGNPSRLLSCSKPAGWTAKTAWEVSLNHWGWTLFLYCQWEGADILLFFVFFLTRQFRLVPPCPAPSALPLAETLCSRLARSCVTVPLHLL